MDYSAVIRERLSPDLGSRTTMAAFWILSAVSGTNLCHAAPQDQPELEIVVTSNLTSDPRHTDAYVEAIQKALKRAFDTLSISDAAKPNPALASARYRLLANHQQKGPISVGANISLNRVAGGPDPNGGLTHYKYTWNLAGATQSGTMTYSLLKKTGDDYVMFDTWSVPVYDPLLRGMYSGANNQIVVAESEWIPKDQNSSPPPCPISLEDAKLRALMRLMPGGIREQVLGRLLECSIVRGIKLKNAEGTQTLKADLTIQNKSPWPVKSVVIPWCRFEARAWFASYDWYSKPLKRHEMSLNAGGETTLTREFTHSTFLADPSNATIVRQSSVPVGFEDVEFDFKGPGTAFRDTPEGERPKTANSGNTPNEKLQNSAEQATGAPDCTGNGRQRGNAWWPKTWDGQREWLELEYADAIIPVVVRIHEDFNPGAVDRVTFFREDGKEFDVWAGKDPTDPKSKTGISEIKVKARNPVQKIRIYLDSPRVKGPNTIDAVGLVDKDGKIYWATGARASSSSSDER